LTLFDASTVILVVSTSGLSFSRGETMNNFSSP
jgi:hypothetical protein